MFRKPVGQEEETPTPAPTQFVDPCSGITNVDRKRECYIEHLSEDYDIVLMDESDIAAHPQLRGVSLEEFTNEQLATILEGVYLTGAILAEYVSQVLGREVPPEEAFRLVYGLVEFGYVPSRDTGLTITTGDPINHDDTIYILLDDTSFGSSVRPPLHPSFVAAHELGHAFHNRHGGKTDYGYAPIAATGFVQATGVNLDAGEASARVSANSGRCHVG